MHLVLTLVFIFACDVNRAAALNWGCQFLPLASAFFMVYVENFKFERHELVAYISMVGLYLGSS